MNARPSHVSRTVRARLAGGLFLVVGSLLEAAGVIELPRTSQMRTFAVGDDGALQLGVAWPSPRFTDRGDGKVLWTRALDDVARLKGECFLGHRDWRLPNIRELASPNGHEQANPCLSAGHPFTKVQAAYFSSTSFRRRLPTHP